MTQSFNLSQLANNLNSSGQLDATDGLFGALPVGNGGTGQSSLTANNVILGNGTSGVQFVAPGTSGNALVSNGTTWQSGAISQLSTASGSAPSYSARAWVNFNGFTQTIRGSQNVSSVSFVSNGCNNVNLTTGVVDTNAAPMITTWRESSGTSTNGYARGSQAFMTSASVIRTQTWDSISTPEGHNFVYVCVFR